MSCGSETTKRKRRRKREDGESVDTPNQQATMTTTADDSSCRKRRRILDAEGGSLDISDAPTLVEDLSTNTSSLEQTTDEELEITSRIDPRLLEDGLTKR
jgi:hypothetical protein